MLTSTVNTVNVTGSSAVLYNYNQPIHKKEDLVVYVSGVIVPSSGGSNPHTIVVASNKQSATVTFDSAPNGLALKFVRIVDYKQETDLANNSLFDAESLETTLDNIVMQVQQVGNVVTSAEGSRTFSFDGGIDDFDSDAATASTLNSDKDARKGRALMFHETTGDIDVSSGQIENTIDYTLEAEQWARKASGNVNTFVDGVEQSDGSAISAKAQATAAATSAGSAEDALESFEDVYRGASTSTPADPEDGQLWFDTTAGVKMLKVYDLSTTSWKVFAPSSAHQTNIDLVVADPLKTNIGLVAAVDGEIALLSVLDTEIGLLGTSPYAHPSTGFIKKVADITAGDVTKVADIDGEVGDVAAIDTEIGTLINGTDGTSGTNGSVKNILLVNSVHGKITEIGNLGTSAVVAHLTALNGTNVITHMAALNGTNVITHMANLNASNVITHIAALNATNVITHIAALNASNVITNIAALNASNVITNIGLCAAVDGEIADVAAIDDKVTIVAGLGSSGAHVTTVAGLNTEITALGASAVVGYLTALNASGVIGNMANLNGSGVITNMANLNASGVIANIANLNGSGVIVDMGLIGATGVIANIETVADNVGSVNSFALRYRVLSSEPGSANDAGDLYFNTTNNTLYSYGTSWSPTALSAVDSANMSIVAGELTYEEDYGLITDAATTSSGNNISEVAAIDDEINLLAARTAEIILLGTNAMANATTGALKKLGTTGVVADLSKLADDDIIADMAALGDSGVADDMETLSAAGVVDDMETVANSIADVNRYAEEYTISGSTPGSPSEGDLWYDSISNVLKFHNGTSFAAIAAETHTQLSDDTNPTLGAHLDADDKNLTNVGTISGDDLKLDFGSIA